MRDAAVLAAAVDVASIGAYIAFRPEPATRLEFGFSKDHAKNVYETIIPEDGQICIVDDLNHRAGPVADPVKDYWDVEGAHWIIGLNRGGDVMFHSSVLSRTGPENIPVSAKSYCQQHKAGETIQISVRSSADSKSWYVKLPAMN